MCKGLKSAHNETCMSINQSQASSFGLDVHLNALVYFGRSHLYLCMHVHDTACMRVSVNACSTVHTRTNEAKQKERRA